MNKINLYILLLVLVILNASHAYATVTWMPGTWQGVVGILMLIACKMSYKNLNKISNQALVAYFIMAVSGVLGFGFNITGLSRFVIFLPVITFFVLKREDLINIVNSLNLIFSVLLSLSLLLFLLNLLGVGIPSSGLMSYNNQYYLYNHLFLYVEVPIYGYSFTGFSLEPGYFSLFLICMILVNEFDFTKKSVWLYVFCLILSLSLEGYLLLIIGFLLQRSLMKRSLVFFFKYLLFTTGILIVITIVALTYNNGDNVLVEEIISRLVLDEELGVVGNNRESDVAKAVLDEFFYSSQVWSGVGYDIFKNSIDKVGFDAASARVFIVVYGAIYTIVFFVLSCLLEKRTIMRYTLPFFIIYWLDFIPHGDLFAVPMYVLLIYMMINKAKQTDLMKKATRKAICNQSI